MKIPFSTRTAVIVASVMLVAAIGVGATAGLLMRPGPTPTPTPLARPSATAEQDSGPLVFTQPLSAGCASQDAVWVFSDGGGIGRFEREKWTLIDGTLRSLVAAACGANTAIAVGGAGRVVTVDDRAKTIRADDVGFFDFHGVSVLLDGAFAVGSQGAVRRQTFAGWEPFAEGIDEDLFGVAAFSGQSAWIVGAAGATYRLEQAGWREFKSGTTSVLRTVSGTSGTDVVAAGDDGVVLRFDGTWKPLASGTRAQLRASTRVGPTTYVVGDSGIVLAIEGSDVRRVELGTSCTLTSVFARDSELWFVGYTGTRAGAWRKTGDKLDRWGNC